MKKDTPRSRKDNLVVQEMDGEVLIYDLNDNKAFSLNETSALIWQICDGEKTTTEISDYIGKKMNSPANEDLVWLAIDQLKKKNLIENGDTLQDHFAGMSRREIIKKVGLGTMIALPVVVGMVVPTSVNAASCATCTCNDASGSSSNSPCDVLAGTPECPSVSGGMGMGMDSSSCANCHSIRVGQGSPTGWMGVCFHNHS